MTAEMESEISALAGNLEATFTDWSKAPKHDMRVLDARRAAATDLKAKSNALSKRLDDLQREAQNKLVEAGVEQFAAQSESIRFTSRFGAMRRSHACDSIVRACDRVIDECDLLKPAFSKWSIDAKGEITSKDFAFKGRANGLRSQIEFAVRDSDELRQRLEDGR